MFLFPMELIGHMGLKLLVIIGRGEELPKFCSYEKVIFLEAEYVQNVNRSCSFTL